MDERLLGIPTEVQPKKESVRFARSQDATYTPKINNETFSGVTASNDTKTLNVQIQACIPSGRFYSLAAVMPFSLCIVQDRVLISLRTALRYIGKLACSKSIFAGCAHDMN